MSIKSIADWPKSCSGAWVVTLIEDYLISKGLTKIQAEEWFNAPLSCFGGMPSWKFVEKIMACGNAESYADAWHEVLGQVKRIYG